MKLIVRYVLKYEEIEEKDILKIIRCPKVLSKLSRIEKLLL